MIEEQKTEIIQTEQNDIEKSDTSGKPNGRKLGAVGVMIVLLIALVVGITIYNTPANRLSRQIDLGNRYLEEQEYEQAIVAFDKSIVINPMSVDAYLGKAEAYEGMGDTDMALQTLREGYDLTGDERLKKKISEIENTIEESQLTEGAEIDRKETLDGQKEADKVVQYDFELSDFGIAEYDMFDNHFEEVCSSFGVPIKQSGEQGIDYVVDNEYGHMSANYDERNLFNFLFNSSDYGVQYEEILTGDAGIRSYQLSSTYYDDDWPSHPSGVVTSPEFVNMPFEIGNTYDEWCEFINFSEIDNKGIKQQPVSSDTKCEYLFTTKWGEGHYLESVMNGHHCWWQIRISGKNQYIIRVDFNDEGRIYVGDVRFVMHLGEGYYPGWAY